MTGASSRLRVDLFWGVLWLVALFGLDATTSRRAIGSSLAKVRHDPSVRDVVEQEVLLYVGQMFWIYLVMGMAAGVVVHQVLRVRGGRRAWLQRATFFLFSSAWMWIEGAVVHPRIYHGFWQHEWWVRNASPWGIDLVFGGLGLAWLGWGAWRHRPSARSVGVLALMLLGVSLADAQWPASTPGTNRGPNVLIVGLDALRPDHLGFYGYDRDTTPRLDAFLERSTTFESTFTPLARTWPAWTSLLTGSNPPAHGMRDSLPVPGQERPQVPMVTDPLVEAGIHTRFVTDDSRFSYMVPAHNFDVIDQPPVNIRAFAPSRYQPHWRPFFGWLNGPLGWWMAPEYRHNQGFGGTYRSEVFAEHVVDQLAEAAEHDSFFMAVHICTLHAPGDRPWPWYREWGLADSSRPNRFRYLSTGSKLADAGQVTKKTLTQVGRRSASHQRNLYDAGLSAVDDAWGRIEDALEVSGLLENTLVVVLSDHGEDFWHEELRYKYRAPNHGFHPWGIGQHRVLLALHGPEVPVGVRTELASLVDVAPTVLDWFGLEETMEGATLLEPLGDRVIYGETGARERGYWREDHKRYRFRNRNLRYTLDPESKRVFQRSEVVPQLVAAKDRWAIQGDWWLVELPLKSGPETLLFRWREDPEFRNDLAEDHPEVVERLQGALPER